MPEKTADRRTLKTRKALVNALSELLTVKELHKITVQEICDKADVNRATLYRHYLDVYDLYDKIEKDTIVSFGLLMLELEELPAEVFFRKITDYISENRSIFAMAFCPNSTGQLRSKLCEMITGVFVQKQLEKADSKLTETDLSYMCTYRAQGCIAVIAEWVTKGFTEPAETISGIISRLDQNTEKLL